MAIRAIALFECWCPGWFHMILTFELVYIMFFYADNTQYLFNDNS